MPNFLHFALACHILHISFRILAEASYNSQTTTENGLMCSGCYRSNRTIYNQMQCCIPFGNSHSVVPYVALKFNSRPFHIQGQAKNHFDQIPYEYRNLKIKNQENQDPYISKQSIRPSLRLSSYVKQEI